MMDKLWQTLDSGGAILWLLLLLSGWLGAGLWALQLDSGERLPATSRSLRRRWTFYGSMVAAAPLLGLLGTVSGMRRSFQVLDDHSGPQAMKKLVPGLAEALLTTQAGLVIAIFGGLWLAFLGQRVRRAGQREEALLGAGKGGE